MITIQKGMPAQRHALVPVCLACLLCVLAGCSSPSDSDRRASADTAGAARQASAEPEKMAGKHAGSSDQALPPHGRGRAWNQQNRVVGRGRARARAIVLSQNEVQSLEIATARVGYRSIRPTHSAMGKVLAPQTRMAKVTYAFPARVSAVHVNIGAWVDKGQAVLTLQSEEVGRAKSDYYKAIADLELARSNYEREKRLFSRGVGAQKNTLTTEAEFKVAQTNLDAAEKKLHVLGFSEADVKSIAEKHLINPEITLFAPIGGRIIEHKALLGAMVDQSSELLTIMDPTLLWVDAEIFERDIAKIRIGQDVQIALPAYPGEVFRGKISYIGDLMNQETRTITVRTEVQNRGYKLKPGMFADVTIFLDGAQRVLTVPATAVLQDSDENIVFVKADGQFAPQVVTVGIAQDDHCTITEGLKEGQEVVVKGSYLLKSKMYDELLRKAGVH